MATLKLMHLSMLSPREGTPGICGAFDFSEELLVKIPTMEPQNLVKSDQISPPWGSISLNFIVVVAYILQIIWENEKCCGIKSHG